MVTFISTIFSLLPLISTLVSATPINARQTPAVSVTLIGAANAQYTMEIPVNSAFTHTNNDLSISHISTSGGGPCVFFGVDGAIYVSPPQGGYGDVGPPQTIAGGICGPFPGHDYGMW
ncbi:uncharacterized protein Z518_08297 [Rhinocladiella mackenziei CBS 650.93]|uniref:Uncharacterized protein n=1 Tax=Rhinocladiella mackenziei CBS 650.93 TaxID=1442369 RepID=A0A0D2IGE5_9EURO|nr:uncharacterized protein Z518_08297 [Rhinocladiella mackenziei CBS 650.93]KIX02356.1 hypothetical protein Z518_08297 [Rhinocladiella mackenziei CBS 650.93]